MNRVALQSKDNTVEQKLYMAMELSDKCWKLVFGGWGEKRRHETMEAGHRMELVEAIRKAKEKFDLSPEVRVVSCYEAGRDGFWLHRYLVVWGLKIRWSTPRASRPTGGSGGPRRTASTGSSC